MNGRSSVSVPFKFVVVAGKNATNPPPCAVVEKVPVPDSVPPDQLNTPPLLGIVNAPVPVKIPVPVKVRFLIVLALLSVVVPALMVSKPEPPTVSVPPKVSTLALMVAVCVKPVTLIPGFSAIFNAPTVDVMGALIAILLCELSVSVAAAPAVLVIAALTMMSPNCTLTGAVGADVEMVTFVPAFNAVCIVVGVSIELSAVVE